jgi:hypothetical protein
VTVQGIGDVTYELRTQPVSLDGSAGTHFAKFSTRYTPTSPNLPEWRFLIGDDQTSADGLDVEAHLFLTDGDQRLDVGAAPVSFSNGAGYNRAVVITWSSSAGDGGLSPAVGLRSGHYTLEVHAFDDELNEAVRTVEWDQTVLPPPIRQRQDPNYQPWGCDPCRDDRCAEHYLLSTPIAMCLGQLAGGASTAIAGAGLRDGRLLAGAASVDNPNDIGVRFRLRPTSTPPGLAARSGRIR